MRTTQVISSLKFAGKYGSAHVSKKEAQRWASPMEIHPPLACMHMGPFTAELQCSGSASSHRLCCAVLMPLPDRYFTNDYQTGLLMHSAKSMAMMAAIIGSFMFTGFMYVAGSNAPKA